MTASENNQRGIIITGVSSGIGAAIARHFLTKGYRVFGSLRKSGTPSGSSLEEDSNFTPLIFDVRDKDAVIEAYQIVQKKMLGQPLYGLINNAGLAAFGPMECLDDDEFATIINVNLMGVRTVTNAFLPLLRGSQFHKPGKIINISSLSGILNTPMNGAYCVSKHALESMGEIYRRELLPAGIDVVSIRSGPVQSDIWSKAEDDDEIYQDADYRRMAHSARDIMSSAEEDAIPAVEIAYMVEAILTDKKKRTAYHMSKGALVARLLRALPDRFADRLITGALMKQK